jgi:hypothetical protein
MKDIARVVALDWRTIVPYRRGILLIAILVMAVTASSPDGIVPAVVLLAGSVTASFQFMIADKEDLDTLYASLPVTRRSLVYGHYALALVTFVVYAGAGTLEAVISARVQDVPFGGGKLGAVLAGSWLLFVLNVAIKLPLFVRFGYSQIGMLGTTVPVAVIAVFVSKTHMTMPTESTLKSWLIIGALVSVVVFVLSAVVATALDPRRIRRPDLVDA